MAPKQVDMYLYAPNSANPRIHVWQNIPFADGQYTATLMPRWWNSTASVALQLLLIEAGDAPWMSDLPAGPIFTATYTAPASGTPEVADISKNDGGVTNVSGSLSGNTGSHLSGGKIAASVIMPILIVALAVFAWLKFSRAKGKAKRKEWTEAVDKRMSTISTDWKSMSAAGASAAIRNSMADAGNRNSSFSFGAIRPSSVVASEGGQAGIGARSMYSQSNDSRPQMSQLRSGVRTSAFENRVSRVSFATDPRPSMESRRSRAFHTATMYDDAPPLPNRQDSSNRDDAEVGSMSPRQTNGPDNLSTEDIRARIDGGVRGNFDEVMPALSLMRTDGHENDEGSFYPSSQTSPTIPAATHPKVVDHQDYFQTIDGPSTTLFSASPLSPNFPTSPVASQNHFGGMMMQQPLPASVMSPDDMLRAYAERSAATAASRNLVSPTMTGSSTSPSRYSLGAGTGFGAATAGVTYPTTTAGNARPLLPAGPGSYSPSRGAYGVSSLYGEPEGESYGRAE